MPKTLIQALEEIEVKSDELKTVFDEARTDDGALDLSQVKTLNGEDVKSHEDIVTWIREREAELKELNDDARDQADLLKSSDQNSTLLTVLDLLKAPANALEHAVKGTSGQSKALGEMFTDAWDSEQKDREIELDYDVKALFETTAGWAPETTRSGRVVDAVTRPLQITDVIPFNTTQQSAIVYMEETTRTNAAAETAEGGAYQESAFELTEVTSPIRKIAHFIPVTDEQLEDESQVQGYLNNRMSFGLRQRLDTQLLVGAGTGILLEGILNRTGIQTFAGSAAAIIDNLYQGKKQVRVTGRALPSAFLIHSDDWQTVMTKKTTDGIYIYGNPGSTELASIWGLPVVEQEVSTAGVGLVGDFRNFSDVAVKRGVTVKVSDSHSDFFVNGKQAIRADMRAGLQVYRPAAFVEMTALNV